MQQKRIKYSHPGFPEEDKRSIRLSLTEPSSRNISCWRLFGSRPFFSGTEGRGEDMLAPLHDTGKIAGNYELSRRQYINIGNPWVKDCQKIRLSSSRSLPGTASAGSGIFYEKSGMKKAGFFHQTYRKDLHFFRVFSKLPEPPWRGSYTKPGY